MAKDHIIPQFILRGFSINPESKKENQKIMIYDRQTKQISVQKIIDSYMKKDFNSLELEKYLANEYESHVAKTFKKFKETAINRLKHVEISNEEYKRLIRFFVIMWRRNDIQLEKLTDEIEQFHKMMQKLGLAYNEETKERLKICSIEDIIKEDIQKMQKNFYIHIVTKTNDKDETVLKTIKYFRPYIIYNASNIHFLLHNTYATLRYIINKGCEITEFDRPILMIYPISSTVCFCMTPCKEVDIEQPIFNIPIETWTQDDDIKRHIIDSYITKTATSFVVDETNLKFVQEEY